MHHKMLVFYKTDSEIWLDETTVEVLLVDKTADMHTPVTAHWFYFNALSLHIYNIEHNIINNWWKNQLM